MNMGKFVYMFQRKKEKIFPLSCFMSSDEFQRDICLQKETYQVSVVQTARSLYPV